MGDRLRLLRLLSYAAAFGDESAMGVITGGRLSRAARRCEPPAVPMSRPGPIPMGALVEGMGAHACSAAADRAAEQRLPHRAAGGR